jgi:hypothetical protein
MEGLYLACIHLAIKDRFAVGENPDVSGLACFDFQLQPVRKTR